MPREKELYADTLERIRQRADTLYPDKLLYTRKEQVAILGLPTAYELRARRVPVPATCEQLARAFS
ncbi:hypothetical protein [Candidatus Allofournierella excrementavium]|uniref:hypothetical protein n=1 Tax=Candidatus Allofournierella excrementavium TaxID=2838591 RepID=UPI003AB916FD